MRKNTMLFRVLFLGVVLMTALIFAIVFAAGASAAPSPQANEDVFIPEIVGAYVVDSQSREICAIPIEFVRTESIENADRLDADDEMLFVKYYNEARKANDRIIICFFWADVDPLYKTDENTAIKLDVAIPEYMSDDNLYVKINSIDVADEYLSKDDDVLHIIMHDFGAVEIGNYLDGN